LAERSILHIDMDAFFASVHQRDDPSLRGKPVLVGGRSKRSVVTAASYESRPFGCRSAMPMGEALRLCPHAIVVEPARGKYEEASREVFDVFRHYTPLVEGLSIDEAFLDVTASQSLFGDGETIARKIKDEVKSVTRLVASAGVAPCKFVAKVASDFRKPDGLVVVREEDVRQFLAPMPIERMWGVGPKTAPHLRALGYATLGDLANGRREDLERHLGVWGEQVRLLARGEDPREVEPHVGAKTIGSEETFENDLTTRDEISRALLDQSARVAQRLLAEGYSAGTVVVKIKYADFTSKTRQVALPDPVCDTSSIHRAAQTTLDRFGLEDGLFRVRLTGIAAAGLVEGPPPKLLFDDRKTLRGHDLEKVAAAIAGKFDGALLQRATQLDKPESRTQNRGTAFPKIISPKTISKERGR
jgi:DNA polymerase-4